MGAPRPRGLAGAVTRGRLLAAVLLVGTGGYLALRPLWSRVPLTPSRWVDAGLALLLLLRGWQYLRAFRGNPAWPRGPR